MDTRDVLIKVGATAANADKFAAAIDKTMAEFSISNDKRRAMFIAQIMHESGNLVFVKENLNYSSDALLRVFPKYFPDRATADAYARKPDRIGSRVYANRMGNGPESSGEGYDFCGRGLIQITGKENYTNCGAKLGVDLVADADYLETPEGAARSAGWFWNRAGLNTLADAGDIITCTKRINGGTNGLDDRQKKYNLAKAAYGI